MGKILVRRVAFLSDPARTLGRAGGSPTSARRSATQIDRPRRGAPGQGRRAPRRPQGQPLHLGPPLLLNTPEGIRRPDPRSGTACARTSSPPSPISGTHHCERANLPDGPADAKRSPSLGSTKLSNAMWGDFSLIGPRRGGRARRQGPARLGQGAAGRADRRGGGGAPQLPRGARPRRLRAGSRGGAPKRAMFDTVAAGPILARRYEAKNEREMFRALRELRKVEKEAAENRQSYQACQQYAT